MTIPSNVYGIGVLMVLVLPGIVWTNVRASLRGHLARDGEVGSRILHALVISAGLAAAYMLVGGPWLVRQARLVLQEGQVEFNPRLTGVIVLVLFVGLPAAGAWFRFGGIRWKSPMSSKPGFKVIPYSDTGYDSTPTAWDKSAPVKGNCYVRIRIEKGHYVGGWYSSNSYVSTYPEPRDIYIERQHNISTSGDFEASPAGASGLWLRVQDHYIVDWIQTTPGAPAGVPAPVPVPVPAPPSS